MGHLNQHLTFDHCKPKGQEVVDNETSVISVVRLLTLMIRQKSKISVERLLTHIGFVNRYINLIPIMICFNLTGAGFN